MPKKGTNKKKYNYQNKNKRKIARAAMNTEKQVWQNLWREPRGGPITHISVEDYLKEQKDKK